MIGRRLTLDDHVVDIIGVTPPSFFGIEVGQSFDVALPLCAEAIVNGENNRLDAGTVWWLTVVGRLKPGVSVEQANAQVAALSAGLFEATLPRNYPPESIASYLAFKLGAFPGGSGSSLLRERYTSPLWLLLAITGMVLLIACANLANLMLARANARGPRDCRAPGDWRVARQGHSPAARRKPAACRNLAPRLARCSRG